MGKLSLCGAPKSLTVQCLRQAEQQRVMQAQESARTRVREIEAAVNRVQRELEEVEEKERNAFALKENSIGEHFCCFFSSTRIVR